MKNLLEQKCDNAGVFRDLTDEEVEARLKAEDQSPLSLIKNLINNKHKIDSSASPQNDAFRHTEQSEVSQSIQGDGEILRHFVPQNDSLPTAGAMEDFETVLIPNDGDSEVLQPLGTEFTPKSVDSGVSQPLETEFTPNSGDIGISQQLVTSFTPTPTPVENRANATSSLTIKDADGAKPQTLAAGDKLNVTYVYEDKTFNYTIEAKSAQNVTLQTKDGYFTVVGDNLAVQTGDEQYSFVALIGTTNSLQIGTNGKKYSANSIAYNSAEGGHSVYTWGDTPEPEADLKLARANSGSSLPSTGTITATAQEQTVLLTNPFTGENYTYKIKIRDTSELSDYDGDPVKTKVDFTSQNVNFEFLANGRLVITGNYVDMTAGEGQIDDIILLGHFNNLRTGDLDDIVRVGYAADSKGYYYIDTPSQYAENGHSTSLYQGVLEGKALSNAYCAIGNHIYTGSGDDHVTMALYQKDGVTSVDMGDGTNDTFMASNGSNDATGYRYTSLSDVSLVKNGSITGAEIVRSKYQEEANSLDNIDGWGTQGGLNSDGACLTLSLINSLGKGNNNLNIKETFNLDITTTDNGNTYTVKFNNYNPPSGKYNEITFSKNDFLAVNGDLDTVILLTAIGKLAIKNIPNIVYDSLYINNGPVAALGNHYKNELANYLFGKAKSCQKYNTTFDKTQFLNLASHFFAENGDLSHIIPCFGIGDKSVGQIGEHAYALKSVEKIPGSEDKWYVELVNPWDDEDVVRFSLDYLLNKSKTNLYFIFYGYSESEIDAFMENPFVG